MPIQYYNANGKKDNHPHISVVIPIYECELFIEELYDRLVTQIEKITKNFEIVMVEDCGEDGSWGIIKKLSNQDGRVKGIQFSRNFGQHYGITAGLDHCMGDWVVVMDGDLQDRPEEIPGLYAKAQEGFDIVLARRVQRQDPVIQKLFSRVFYRVFNYLTGMNYDPRVGNFRILSKKVVANYCNMKEQLRFFGGLVDWLGFSTAYIDIYHDRRFSGKSSYTLKKRWKLAFEAIIAYSDKPLKLSVQLGFLMSILAFCYGTYVVYSVIFRGIDIQGWSSLIVSIYFIGGVIIANLGIIGIYLGKTFDEVKNRPLYIIKERINV